MTLCRSTTVQSFNLKCEFSSRNFKDAHRWHWGVAKELFFFHIIIERILNNNRSIDQQVISSVDLHNDFESIVSGRNLHKIQSIDTQTRIPSAARKIIPILISSLLCVSFYQFFFSFFAVCQRISIGAARRTLTQHSFSAYQFTKFPNILLFRPSPWKLKWDFGDKRSMLTLIETF